MTPVTPNAHWGKAGWTVLGMTIATILIFALTILKNWLFPPAPPVPNPEPLPAHKLIVPTSVKTEVGKPIPIEVDTDASQVWWTTDIDKNLSCFRSGKNLLVWSQVPKEYRLAVFRDDGNSPRGPIYVTVTVGNPLPPPPPPPPPPPGPDPPPPTPVPVPDATLLTSLQGAYTKDTDAKKNEFRTSLAGIYKVASTSTILKPELKTVKDIDSVIRDAAQAEIGVLSVPNLRDAIGTWLKTQVPTRTSTPLDDEIRGKFQKAFASIALALENVR